MGSSTHIASTGDNDEHRTEVLRLLLVLLSRSMYVPPAQILAKKDRWLHCVAGKTERKVVLALLCSLLNTACKFNPLNWNIPYKYTVFPSDTREQLIVTCLRSLLVILDYLSPREVYIERQRSRRTSVPEAVPDIAVLSIQDTDGHDEHNTTQASSSETSQLGLNDPSDNMFVFYLSKLHREEDFQFLYEGIYRNLLSPMKVCLYSAVRPPRLSQFI